ncbi:large ribosomal subunit protein uL29m [Monosporozyma unispora]|nr:54S ribosomal protein L4 mitochondrial [Kazachstania unispora]
MISLKQTSVPLAKRTVTIRPFHHFSSVLARTKYSPPRVAKEKVPKPPLFPLKPTPGLKVAEAIPPTRHNIECPETHPLWQFFHDKQFIRPTEQLDTTSRSWSIPELRRKSFNDLHSLWYNCLRERNKLAREIHLIRAGLHTEGDHFVAVDERVRTTMWRIRHVLSERDHAFTRAFMDSADREDLIQSFSKEFMESTNDSEEHWEQLKRFQWAVYGINETIEDNTVIDETFVEGLKCVANLKLQKLSTKDDQVKDWYETKWGNQPLTDIAQCFVIFSCENDVKATLEACSVVEDLRSDPTRLIPKENEVTTVKSYINQLISSNEE